VKDEPEKSPKKKEEQKDENPIDEKNREEKTGSDYKDYVRTVRRRRDTCHGRGFPQRCRFH
jgi:hypothetical protein